MSTLALIGLGSNLGDRKTNLDEAIRSLRATPGIEVSAVSAYRETRPVGGPSHQGPFLNAAAALQTTLDPFDLLRTLQAAEARAGRVRTERWGERTLDLDLLLFSDQIIHTARAGIREFDDQQVQLRVPHPLMALRRFVLAPLAEIAAEVVHPVTGRTITELLANIDRRPSYLALPRAHDDALLSQLFDQLVDTLQAEGIRISDIARQALPRVHGLRDQVPGQVANLSQLFESLRRDRWSDRKERWLVSDFAPFQVVEEAAECAVGGDAGVIERLALLVVDQEDEIVKPTFYVQVPSSSETSLSAPQPDHALDRSARVPGSFSLEPDVPVLDVELGSLEAAVSEIVATCQATRTG